MMNDSLAVLQEEMEEIMRQAGGGATFPPKCFLSMKAEFVSYESRQSLIVTMPVLDESLNPVQMMQGGFIGAAFDNAFGPLSYLAARAPCATMNLSVQFIRPVELGERLTVHAKVASRGIQVLHMTAEAFNSKNKLVAAAVAGAAVMRSASQSKG
ncbi:MAG TPA: PaaI family thioesterase [Bacteroidetes bacterium]|nr:PaaI family thioesterase [Bacteroidota bacterium]